MTIRRISLVVENASPAQIAVVLVRARNPLNIGAAARAMSNFGFDDLRIVTDYPVPFAEARSAVNAGQVLANAREFASVEEAVADCALVYGTTALGERRLLHPVDLLRDAALRAIAQAIASGSKTAILFGSEKGGLSASEMSHCHRLLTIPMHEGGVSMNLGQAVAVCLYELIRGSATAPRTLPAEETPASAEELARFDTVLNEVLHATGYSERYPANMDADGLRRLIRRLQLSSSDTPVWLGILRQVLWSLRK